MIAWTGVLAYKCGLTIPIEESHVKLRWRLDEAPVPWVRKVDADLIAKPG